jgi:hypothetical protein
MKMRNLAAFRQLQHFCLMRGKWKHWANDCSLQNRNQYLFMEFPTYCVHCKPGKWVAFVRRLEHDHPRIMQGHGAWFFPTSMNWTPWRNPDTIIRIMDQRTKFPFPNTWLLWLKPDSLRIIGRSLPGDFQANRYPFYSEKSSNGENRKQDKRERKYICSIINVNWFDSPRAGPWRGNTVTLVHHSNS